MAVASLGGFGDTGESSPTCCRMMAQLPGQLGGGRKPGLSGIRSGEMGQVGLTHDGMSSGSLSGGISVRGGVIGGGCSHELRQLTALTALSSHGCGMVCARASQGRICETLALKVAKGYWPEKRVPWSNKLEKRGLNGITQVSPL